MAKKSFKPVHPGEILLEDFLKPLNITPGRLATLIGVDRRRTMEIVNGKRDVSADTALRLARLFDMTPDFWLNLQKHYDLECAKDALWKNIKCSIKPLSASTHA